MRNEEYKLRKKVKARKRKKDDMSGSQKEIEIMNSAACKSKKRNKKIKILSVEDNPGDVRLLQEMLAEVNGSLFELDCVDRLSIGLERLVKGGVDLVLLDLGLPDSQGFETFHRVRAQAPHVPIVIMTEFEDEVFAIRAVRMGAQDYLVKGQVNGKLLERVIHYAVERNHVRNGLRDLSLLDELTGVYNRRGFFILAKQHFKLAHRTKRGLWLFFVDFDGLKEINDKLGHNEGSRALIDAANILKKSFRESDIIARLGGDEFAVFAIGADRDCLVTLTKDIQKNLKVFNKIQNRHYQLSFSIGTAYFDPQSPCSIDELLVQADKSMYEQKRTKRNSESEEDEQKKS